MESNMIKLEGTVSRVTFYSEHNGYIVFNLATDTKLVTAVGTLGMYDVGDTIVAYGNYTVHEKFGEQFKVSYCEKKPPTTRDGIKKYLASGVIKGIKSSLADKIVEAFGEDALEIIENDPERLAEIKGISKKKALEISNDFKDSFHTKKVIEFLMGFGISSATAIKLSKKYGFETLEKLHENPYILCDDNINVPFELADKVAKQLGISHDSIIRISAGFRCVLNDALLEGHTCLPKHMFLSQSYLKLKLSIKELKVALDVLLEENILDAYESDVAETYIYLHKYYTAEQYISIKIWEKSFFKSPVVEDHSQLISLLEKSTGILYNQRQKEAISMSLDSYFMVLTGGPGTGKTTTLNGIIDVLECEGLSVSVTAPTGRATKRITEITGHEAQTIHRLLEVSYDKDDNIVFVHNENNLLDYDVIIVDEMSMVDTLLFESLLKAIKATCKLILVGDSNQLPSVSAGTVLKDLIASNKLDVIELDEVFRQAQESAIIMNAHNVIKGQYPNIYLKNNDFFFLQRLDYKSAQSTIVELWKDRLPKTYNYSPLENIQVLCSSRKGNLGTVTLNQLMQNAINPNKDGNKSKEVTNGIYSFREGDKVMQIKNDYQAQWDRDDGTSGCGIYNGDIGIVTKITSSNLEVSFDGRKVSYKRNTLDQLELAYAITIHKSQGSEFDVVIMPMLNNFRQLSYRNLLYTGVTRAKKLLVIVGSRNELFAMVDNNKQILRYSNLKQLIQKNFDEEI